MWSQREATCLGAGKCYSILKRAHVLEGVCDFIVNTVHITYRRCQSVCIHMSVWRRYVVVGHVSMEKACGCKETVLERRHVIVGRVNVCGEGMWL
jgi:hypothetical protein